MPAPADAPIRRCNLYLYKSDWEWLSRKHGHGISDVIRRLVHEHVKEREQPQVIEWPPKTIP